MVYFTELIGIGTLFYAFNYGVYRYYFKKPMVAQNLVDIVNKNLKRRFYELKLSDYNIQFKFGLNGKPISSQYEKEHNANTIYNDYLIFLKNRQNTYECLNPLNTNLKIIDGISQILRINSKSNYYRVGIQQQQTECQILISLNIQRLYFNKKLSVSKQFDLQKQQIEYLYIIMKKNNIISIAKQLGQNIQDVDFIDKVINHTIKLDVDYPHESIEFNREWFDQHYSNIQCILSMDSLYNLYNVSEIEEFEIKTGDRIYRKIIENLEREIILYL